MVMREWTKPSLDDAFARVVTTIQKRAEDQINWDKLIDTYAHTDLALRAGARDSQLILGRRGTGKTHMFRVLAEELGSKGEVTCFIDCRNLGSGIIGTGEKAEQIAIKYFRTLLNEIGTRMLDKAVHMENPQEDVQKTVINTLISLVNQMEPSLDNIAIKPTFNYRQITDSLRAVISGLDISNMIIILDEWVQIPVSVQPYVAEYIKRAIMTIPEVCFKFLAVSYQCHLSKQTDEGIIGTQRGADIPDVIDFDAYLIYDENPNMVTEFFSEVLYNHLGAELNWDLSLKRKEKAKRIVDIFSQENVFIELVRAAEGNCRDFLCIFSRAFWEGYRQQTSASTISITHIRDAASSWFDNEKYVNLRDEPLPIRTFAYIMNHIIKGYKSRTFMVEAAKAQSPILTRLLNERILHRLSGYYSHKDRPGERYELFNIDYGAYIRFKGTVNEPYLSVLPLTSDVAKLPKEEQQFLVPLDDKRSIRRIVFDPEAFQLSF